MPREDIEDIFLMRDRVLKHSGRWKTNGSGNERRRLENDVIFRIAI
tara:strand:- start:118 stop:255 length:138 start_codon:yes stop_codon:yes gene_type:complete